MDGAQTQQLDAVKVAKLAATAKEHRSTMLITLDLSGNDPVVRIADGTYEEQSVEVTFAASSATGPTINPALYSDHGRWQVVHDEVCLFLPRIGTDNHAYCFDGKSGYWLCRAWCLLHGYGWLPVET